MEKQTLSERLEQSSEDGAAKPGTKWARVPAILLSLLNLAAIGLSVELTRIHIQVNLHPDATSFCTLAHEVSCLNVAESRFSVFAGLPVSVWSILGQLGLAALIWPSLFKRRRFGLGLLTTSVWLAVIVSLVMAAISGFVIHSLCLLCSGLGLANLAMAVTLTWQMRRSEGTFLSSLPSALARDLKELPKHRGMIAVAVLLAIATLAGIIWYPKYWEIPPRGGPGDLSHGFTPDGHPWIGAKSPQVIIEEFTDYQCPFCRRAHDQVRTLLERHKDRIRLIHRDFPLDHHCNPEVHEPYHLRACELARAARCAGRQHRYWHMADMLFARQPRAGGPDPYVLAHRLGLDMNAFDECMGSQEVRQAVRQDIDEANKKHLDGTPTYFLNGQRIHGWPNESVLQKLLAEPSR